MGKIERELFCQNLVMKILSSITGLIVISIIVIVVSMSLKSMGIIDNSLPKGVIGLGWAISLIKTWFF